MYTSSLERPSTEVPDDITYLYVMQRLTTLLLLAGITLTAKAQIVPNYQPDADGDGCIGLSDMLVMLSIFGSCEPQGLQCGDPVSYQGYDYATVLIGEQCWFAENLRSENYENGDEIPAYLNDNEWENTSFGAVAVYGEGNSDCFHYSPDGDACDESWALTEYGRLYNFHAVDDARGLCPSGWHVPTDGEWTVMTDHLDGEAVAGGQLKADYGWSESGNGTNSSGFAGLPGGFRTPDGRFGFSGTNGLWWTSTSEGSYAWHRSLQSFHSWASGTFNGPQHGYSVRCVQDSEE